MITANFWFAIPWEVHRLTVLVPALGKRLIKERTTIDDKPPVKAYVNHGKWCVPCECGGSEYAWEEGLFMCQSCFNSGHGHQYRRSVFPRNREAIENLLMMRPLDNRNWYTHETLAQLKAENEAHKKELI